MLALPRWSVAVSRRSSQGPALVSPRAPKISGTALRSCRCECPALIRLLLRGGLQQAKEVPYEGLSKLARLHNLCIGRAARGEPVRIVGMFRNSLEGLWRHGSAEEQLHQCRTKTARRLLNIGGDMRPV